MDEPPMGRSLVLPALALAVVGAAAGAAFRPDFGATLSNPYFQAALGLAFVGVAAQAVRLTRSGSPLATNLRWLTLWTGLLLFLSLSR